MKFARWLGHEIRAVVAATLFFGACFFVIMLLKGLLLEEYHIEASSYFAALMVALVTAKVVVVLDKVSFGRPIGLIEVLARTAAYSFAAFVLLVIEHGFSTRHEAGGFVPALLEAFSHPDMPRVWATLLCVALAFAAYSALSILRRELGAGRVSAAYFKPPSAPTGGAGH